MFIRFDFDHEQSHVFIPDGVIADLEMLKTHFLDWAFDQSQCIGESNGKLYLSFDETDFVEYLNEVWLSDYTETAYLLPAEKVRQKVVAVIRL